MWGKVIYCAKAKLDKKLISSIWRRGGYEVLFGELLQGVYENEKELLANLKRVLEPYSRSVLHLDKPVLKVTSRVLFAHGRHFVSDFNKSRREIGDIVFIILYCHNNERVGYLTSYQIKVLRNKKCICFDTNQLESYLNILQKLYDIDNKTEKFIAEFLNYWLIYLRPVGKINKIVDIPASMVLKLSRSFNVSNLAPFRTFSTPTHAFYRHIFNTICINLEDISKIAKPNLKKFIDILLKNGIENFPLDILEDMDESLPAISFVVEMNVKQ